MRDWKPPLKPDRWYAHIWRSLLRKNSRRRAGMSKDTAEKVDETVEEEFHWRYAILEKKHGGETYYHVCEEYPGLGYTDAETPMGESPEDLQTILEMMLADVKGAIEHNNIIVSGEPYDDWRAKELDEGEFLSAEDTEKWLEELAADEEEDIGNDPTVPFITETLDK